MNNYKTRGRSGGSWQGNDSRRQASKMFRAVCAECNESCEVPFKPNGRKPVLCSNCFRQDDGGSERKFAKPAYRSTPRGGDDVAKQIKMLNAKVDQILDILSDLIDDGDEEGDEDNDFEL